MLTLVLYGAIYLLAIRGLLVVIQTFATVEIENAIAKKVYSKSNELLLAIRSETQERVDLERLETYLPKNTSYNAAMLRLFNQIISEARDRRFESGVVLMQTYREESLGDIFKIMTLQKLSLQLGILGTFIGLINAFKGLNLNLEELRTSLNVISGSLQFAFSTSIAGLMASIALGILVISLRKKQKNYFRSMEEASNKLVSLARNSINHDEYLAGFKEVGDRVDQVTQKVKEQNGKVDIQTLAIRKGMEELSKARGEYNLILSEMKDIHKILSPKKISEKLEKSLSESVEGISKGIEKNVGVHLKEYGKISKSSQLLNDNLVALNKQLSEQKEIYEKSNSKVLKAREEIVDSQKNFIKQISKSHVTEHLKKGIVEASQDMTENIKTSIGGVSQGLNVFNNNMNGFQHFTESHLKRARKERIILWSITIILMIVVALMSFKIFLPTEFNSIINRLK